MGGGKLLRCSLSRWSPCCSPPEHFGRFPHNARGSPSQPTAQVVTMLKATSRRGKAEDESSSGWTCVRKATKAKAFANGCSSSMPITQPKSASSTGVRAFTKQKSKSFEEKMDQGGSGPVSEVVSQIQYFLKFFLSSLGSTRLRRKDEAAVLTCIRCQRHLRFSILHCLWPG